MKDQYRAKAAAISAGGPQPTTVSSKRSPSCQEVNPADCFDRCGRSAALHDVVPFLLAATVCARMTAAFSYTATMKLM